MVRLVTALVIITIDLPGKGNRGPGSSGVCEGFFCQSSTPPTEGFSVCRRFIQFSIVSSLSQSFDIIYLYHNNIVSILLL